MTAKELIEAAITLRDCGELCRSTQDDLCNYILATVRPDNDEPVTWDAMAFEPDWRCVELLHDRQEYLHSSGVNILCDNGEFRFRGFPLRSMGHLRRLVAALGE
jgi:hypothetical protein